MFQLKNIKIALHGERCKVFWVTAVCASVCFGAQTPDYEEGWYQIKRTVNMNTLMNADWSNFSSATSLSSLLGDVAYLSTGTELPVEVSVPVLNISAGTAVYGARLLAVDGQKDYAADLVATNGRNVNESELSTYYYITPVAADEEGDWSYTVRSVNGHYMGPDGRYYVEPKVVYFNSLSSFSLDENSESSWESMERVMGVSVGSKAYSLSSSTIQQLPNLDQLGFSASLDSLINSMGSLGMKVSEYTWSTRKVADPDSQDSVTCVASVSLMETLSDLTQNSEELLQLYRDSSYVELGQKMLAYMNINLFRLKKVNIDNVTISSGLIPKHTKVVPYIIDIVGFGDSFSLEPADYRTSDLLTKRLQKTNQNALMVYLGDGAQDKAWTKFYHGGTLFLKSDGEVGEPVSGFELTTVGTDLFDLSKAQSKIVVDNASQTIHVYVSSPKQGEFLGIPTGKWTENYKTVVMDAAGYATLCAPFELSVPEGVHVYAVTSVADGRVDASSLEGNIPAGTPVLVSGDAGKSYNFVVVEPDEASAVPVESNLLTGTYAAHMVNADDTVYCLSLAEDADGSDASCFSLAAEGAVIPAWSAYLTQGGVSVSYSLYLDGVSSGIDCIAEVGAPKSTVVYDLNGRLVPEGATKRGVYIKNGKKVWVK